jgi:hypothetical protein
MANRSFLKSRRPLFIFSSLAFRLTGLAADQRGQTAAVLLGPILKYCIRKKLARRNSWEALMHLVVNRTSARKALLRS